MVRKCSLCKGVGFVASNIGTMRRCPLCSDIPTPKETMLYSVAEQTFKGNKMKNKQDNDKLTKKIIDKIADETNNKLLGERIKKRLDDLKICSKDKEWIANNKYMEEISKHIADLPYEHGIEYLKQQLKIKENIKDRLAMHALKNKISGIDIKEQLKELDNRIAKTVKPTKD